MRLSTAELIAVLHAITSVTAGDGDGWRVAEWNALQRAETIVRRTALGRTDHGTESLRLDASPELDGSELPDDNGGDN